MDEKIVKMIKEGRKIRSLSNEELSELIKDIDNLGVNVQTKMDIREEVALRLNSSEGV